MWQSWIALKRKWAASWKLILLNPFTDTPISGKQKVTGSDYVLFAPYVKRVERTPATWSPLQAEGLIFNRVKPHEVTSFYFCSQHRSVSLVRLKANPANISETDNIVPLAAHPLGKPAFLSSLFLILGLRGLRWERCPEWTGVLLSPQICSCFNSSEHFICMWTLEGPLLTFLWVYVWECFFLVHFSYEGWTPSL